MPLARPPAKPRAQRPRLRNRVAPQQFRCDQIRRMRDRNAVRRMLRRAHGMRDQAPALHKRNGQLAPGVAQAGINHTWAASQLCLSQRRDSSDEIPINDGLRRSEIEVGRCPMIQVQCQSRTSVQPEIAGQRLERVPERPHRFVHEGRPIRLRACRIHLGIVCRFPIFFNAHIGARCTARVLSCAGASLRRVRFDRPSVLGKPFVYRAGDSSWAVRRMPSRSA